MRVTEETFAKEVLSASGPVLVDFYSDSCLACKRMAATLGQLEQEYGEKIKVAKINVKYDHALSEQYSVLSVPAVVLFRDGNEVARFGASSATAQIKQELEASL